MPLIDVGSSNPLSDGRQSAAALAIRRGVIRLFQQMGVSLVAELALASGRRADLVGLDRKGRVVIIEIKSSIADFRADGKWMEYLHHCDLFYFATSRLVPQDIFPVEQGLIVADSYGAEILRQSSSMRLPAPTRKALLMRFGRAAADRLNQVLVHCESTGDAVPAELAQINGD